MTNSLKNKPMEKELPSHDSVTLTYQQSRAHAKKAQVFLILTTFLGAYTLAVTLALVTKASRPPPLVTFLNDQKHGVKEVVPSRNPPVTDRQAIHWSRDKVCDLLSLHFSKYFQQVSRRENYFVGEGWGLYQQSLIDNETIETIKKEGLIITAINQDEPRLMRKYRLNGKINWLIEMSILQTTQGASDRSSTTRKVVSVVVEETRRDESIEGLKIRTFGIIK